ncbi:ZBT11 protein, partial [Polyodon spathula]|nr:ZBT11 protein [Polyodon spathula]
LRYLTDEREPYAPGTEGNVKRKIRKAAACYVVRDGTLYYQRRQKGREKFAELEVVLQAGRRKGLIEAAHITAGGEHLNRHQSWHLISQKYWWRGILKHVKDYIKECSRCQEKQDRTRVWPDSVPLDEFGEDSRTKEDDEGEEEEEEEISISELQSSARPRPSRTVKLVSKHELVFVSKPCESAKIKLSLNVFHYNVL